MTEFEKKLNEYMEANGIKNTMEEESTTEDFKAGYYAENGALNIARVRLLCFQEVFKKFQEIEHESEFYGWLYAKAHEA